jgi:hypothetical protein
MDFGQMRHEIFYTFNQIWSSVIWEVRENPVLVLVAIVGLLIVWRIFSPKIRAR